MLMKLSTCISAVCGPVSAAVFTASRKTISMLLIFACESSLSSTAFALCLDRQTVLKWPIFWLAWHIDFNSWALLSCVTWRAPTPFAFVAWIWSSLRLSICCPIAKCRECGLRSYCIHRRQSWTCSACLTKKMAFS